MNNFEEWWENYEAPQYVLTTDDMRKAFEAGWNTCSYLRCDKTYSEYTGGDT